MTCIVGIEHGNQVLMGGDLQNTWPNMKLDDAQPSKVFIKNGILFGGAGSARVGQIMQHGLQSPVAPERDEEVPGWLVTVLVPEVCKALKDGGHQQEGNDCLVGIRGQLWHLCADFSVMRSTVGYAAVGSGREYAMGSIFTTAAICGLKDREDAERALKRAIAAAGSFSPTVGIDATVLST